MEGHSRGGSRKFPSQAKTDSPEIYRIAGQFVLEAHQVTCFGERTGMSSSIQLETEILVDLLYGASDTSLS